MPIVEGRPAEAPAALQHTWIESDRFVPRVFVRRAQRLLAWELSAGVALLVTSTVAIVWANSAWADSYVAFWSTPMNLAVGGRDLWASTTRGLVNDVAMTLFFFVVSATISQQFVAGELRDRRRAALPVIAAVGGMVVPACVYLSIAGVPATSRGWGVPVATDVAFAVGALTLLGRRVPMGAKLFLLTLAVADDVGGIVVIAVFYPSDVHVAWLAVVAGLLLVAILLRHAGVRALPPYAVIGVLSWLALDRAGIEPTLAGVLMGAVVPVWSFHDPANVERFGGPLLERAASHAKGRPLTIEDYERVGASLRDCARLLRESSSPVERVITRTGAWVSFVVLPAFALANAGVPVSIGSMSHDQRTVALAVGLGLLLGKPLGIVLASVVAIRLGMGRLPEGTNWRVLVGVAMTAGIGFTVALYIAAIGFDDPSLRDAARLGILIGSLASAVTGLAWLIGATAGQNRDFIHPNDSRQDVRTADA